MALTSNEIMSSMPLEVLEMVDLAEKILESEYQYVSISTAPSEEGPVINVKIIDSMAFTVGGGAGFYEVRNGVWAEESSADIVRN